MVELLLRLVAQPGRAQQTIEALRSVMLPVRLQGGVARTRLLSEVGNADAVCYIEEWPTVEDLDTEINTDRFSRLLALMETAAELPTLEFRFVGETRGLDYVNTVRARSTRPDGSY